MRRLLPTAAALTLVAGALAGCGGDGGSDQTEEPGIESTGSPAASPSETVTDLAPDQPSLSPGSSASPDAFAADDAGLTALSTAETAVENARAFELDRSDDDGGRWEVQIAADGVEHEVRVSLDGTTLIDHEREDELDDEDRTRLDAASVAAAEAGFNALSEVSGAITEITLDEERGTVVWEVEVRTSDGADIDVLIDAATGEVL
ncbi:PepSY domain-containing protein [Georgenia wangjunii]|uniref:PepSY domain-containing protein n=1 Tax=Georgenia wangjunii TaxID=3117730 RepID=UPI002F2645B4